MFFLQGGIKMKDKDVDEYFKTLDRALFLKDEYKILAQGDSPLPIGFSQTISQPSLVVEMTKMLAPRRNSKVLEIGTGSGYQTAFLAHFTGEVYTVERIAQLSEGAKKVLDGLGFENIHYRVGDGSYGWGTHAPYDRIMVTCAVKSLPLDLISQLKNNGKMVLPMGDSDHQVLTLIEKNEKGTLTITRAMRVRFVEMMGKYGFTKEYLNT